MADSVSLSDFLSDEEIDLVSKSEHQKSIDRAWEMFNESIAGIKKAGSAPAQILGIASSAQTAVIYFGLMVAFLAANIDDVDSEREQIWAESIKDARRVFKNSLPSILRERDANSKKG